MYSELTPSLSLVINMYIIEGHQGPVPVDFGRALIRYRKVAT